MGRITYDRVEGEEAAKLDEMFGVKDSMIEVNPGRVLLPPDFQHMGMGERIANLNVRSDDVWLVSYPRTGSTWTQEMVWLIGNNLDFEKAKELQQVRAPLLELTAVMMHNHPEWMKALGNSVDIVDNLSSPRFIKTHLPNELLPTQIHTVKPKIVYVARNPKDMCVSYYHHCVLIHQMNGTLEDFCELFLKDKTPVGPIWNHILGFWNRRNDPNVLFLKYEDLKKDHEAAIRTTAAFMEKTLTDNQVKQLADYLSFNKMKENRAVNLEPIIEMTQGAEFLKNNDLRFIRKGQVGDYKNHMSPELIARFDKWTEENLRGTGLVFN